MTPIAHIEPPPIRIAPPPSGREGAQLEVAQREASLREAGIGLESAFLAIMLKSAGVGAPRDSFGGGIGEEQFASYLTDAHAEALMQRGGIGLAEALFNSLKERSDAKP